MRRIISICLLVLSAAAMLVAAPAASAAKKKSQANLPEITRVQPMRVSVGGTLTIKGKRFKSKRSANTVIFRSASGRSAFAKPRRASTTKLRVVVPAAVAGLLTVKNSKQRPTRLKLRVLAGKFSKFTTRRLSPVVTGAGDGDGPGDPAKVCQDDGDHDNDLLSNARELQIGTDPCLEDTDGDNMSDGWEYCSAKDLDVNSVPYPGERPYLNALDPSDGAPGSPAPKFSAYDFDGDGLTSREEYRLWRISGSSTLAALLDGCSASPGQPSTLGYSDGTKISRASETPGVPAWRSASYGRPNPTQPFPATYNLRGDADWRDSERDADADGLSNRLESARGPSTNAWWQGYWAVAPSVQPYPETSFGFYEQRPFADLDLADPDVDGDTLLDGEDDQDNDDVHQHHRAVRDRVRPRRQRQPDHRRPARHSFRPSTFGGGNEVINAMNPCAPNSDSRTCEDYAPF